MESNVNNAIKEFFARLTDEKELLRNDLFWAKIADLLLIGKDDDFREKFWIKLESKFIEKEKTIGHCHKGQIYWRLSIIYLGKGDITKTLYYLNEAVEEDKIRGDNFSAAMGLQSVLEPLLNRYKNKAKKWLLDEKIKEFYDLLSTEQKVTFAHNISLIHDRVVTLQTMVIRENFFDFIINEKIRNIVKDIYFENTEIITKRPINTYYTPIFSIGSILEGMLDDLFQRDNNRIWELFKKTPEATKLINPSSPLKSSHYSDIMTLGQKVKILELMALTKCCPVSENSILMMIIIEEYRNLIHLTRTLEFKFRPNGYIAGFLFQFIPNIASDWWPANVDSKIRSIKSVVTKK